MDFDKKIKKNSRYSGSKRSVFPEVWSERNDGWSFSPPTPRPSLLQEKGKHLKTSKPIDFQFILTRTYLRRARVVDARETNKVLVYQSGSLLKSSVSISYEAGSAPEWPIQKEAFRSSGLQLLFIIFTDVKLMWCRLLYYSLTSCAVTDAEDVFYRYIKSNALSRRFRLIKFY